MNAPLKRNAFSRDKTVERFPGAEAMRLVAVNGGPEVKARRRFPRRPNLHVLNEAIPLFYICQNRHGLWVARDAEGRIGGLFLRKQSALRFAQRQSTTGCAIMQLSESAELDIENQGSRIAALVGGAVDLATRRMPLLTEFVGMVITEWHKLVAQICSVLASGRKHREAAERELFHSQHWLASKSDEDLPVY
jgi:hypothetical protein